MKRYTDISLESGLSSTEDFQQGDGSYITLSVTPDAPDTPPMSEEEKDRALIKDTTNTLRDMKVELSNIAFAAGIIALCQMVMCATAVLK